MRKILVVANWLLSLTGLSVDTEHSPLWAVALAFGWFVGSSLLLIWAQGKPWFVRGLKRSGLFHFLLEEER